MLRFIIIHMKIYGSFCKTPVSLLICEMAAAVLEYQMPYVGASLSVNDTNRDTALRSDWITK